MISRRLVVLTALISLGAPEPSCFGQAASKLPPSPAGWRMSGAARSVSPNALSAAFGAESKLLASYDPKGVAMADYSKGAEPQVRITVFELKDPLNAFGFFSVAHRGKENPTRLGAEGATAKNGAMSFWKEQFVVRVAPIPPAVIEKKAVKAVAEAVANGIPGNSIMPFLMMAMPRGMDAFSEKFVRAGVAGKPFLKNGYTSHMMGTAPNSLFYFCQFDNPAQAKAAYGLTKKGLGPSAKALPRVGAEAVSAPDGKGTTTIVALKGKYVIGFTKAADAARAAMAVGSTAGNLK